MSSIHRSDSLEKSSVPESFSLPIAPLSSVTNPKQIKSSPGISGSLAKMFKSKATQPAAEQIEFQAKLNQANISLQAVKKAISNLSKNKDIKPAERQSQLVAFLADVEKISIPSGASKLQKRKDVLIANIQKLIQKNQKEIFKDSAHAVITSRQAELQGRIEKLGKENAESQIAKVVELEKLKNRLPSMIENFGRQPVKTSIEDLTLLKSEIRDAISGYINDLHSKKNVEEAAAKLGPLQETMQAIEKQEEFLFEQQLKSAPLPVRRLFQDAQNIIGTNFPMPIKQKFALLQTLKDPKMIVPFREYFQKAAQMKAENRDKLAKGELTDVSHLQPPFIAEDASLNAVIMEFDSLLKAKIGQINPQLITDSMLAAPYTSLQEAYKQLTPFFDKLNNGLATSGIKRDMLTAEKAQIANPYLPPAEQSLAKEGFIPFGEYNLRKKIEWTPLRNEKGRMIRMDLSADFRLKRKDGSYETKKFKTSLDFGEIGLRKGEEHEAVAWKLIADLAASSRPFPFPFPIKKLEDIPKEARPLLGLSDEFWQWHDLGGRGLIEDLDFSASLSEAVTHYNTRMGQVSKFIKEINSSLADVLIEETPRKDDGVKIPPPSSTPRPPASLKPLRASRQVSAMGAKAAESTEAIAKKTMSAEKDA